MSGAAGPAKRSLWLQDRCPRLPYGWVVLCGAVVGKVFSSPGQSPIIGIFQESIRADLDESRTVITTLYLIATTTSSLVLPFMGRLLDKVGPLKVMVGTTTALVGACLYMSFIVSDAATLLVGFFFLRFLGQGCMVMISQYLINLWWIKRRGVVMGAGGALMSLGMVGILPPVVRAYVAVHGWRDMYVVFAVAYSCVMLPVALAVFRDKPEAYGLLPDAVMPGAAAKLGKGVEGTKSASEGDVEMARLIADDSGVSSAQEAQEGGTSGAVEADGAGDTDSGAADAAAQTKEAEDMEENWTLKEALHTWAFWAFALAQFVTGALGTAVWFHLSPVMEENGVSDSTVAVVYPLMAVLSASLNVVGGWLHDRHEARFIMGASMLLLAAALMFVGMMSDVTAIGMAICMGVSFGLFANVASTVFANFYGREHLGAITGVTKTAVVFGSAVGPWPFGFARDQTGSFEGAFLASSVIPLLVFVVLCVKGARPRKGTDKSVEGAVPAQSMAVARA